MTVKLSDDCGKYGAGRCMFEVHWFQNWDQKAKKQDLIFGVHMRFVRPI